MSGRTKIFSYRERLEANIQLQERTKKMAAWLLRQPWLPRRRRDAFFRELLVPLIDPHPDRSLKHSAANPGALLCDSELNKITPLQWWKKLEEASRFWPQPIRELAPLLGVGCGRLPGWKNIERYCREIGVRPLPVHGYLSDPFYSFVIAEGLIPFATHWFSRFEDESTFQKPLDTFHDLGHAIAMTMPDYRGLITKFARAVLEDGYRVSPDRCFHLWVTLFESAFVYDSDGWFQPIGAQTFSMDIAEVKNGRLYLLPKAERERSVTGDSLFSSREHWRATVEENTRNLKEKRSPYLTKKSAFPCEV